jgi:hypothetical protein
MRRTALLSVGAVVVIATGGVIAGGTALAAGGSHTLHLTTTRLQFVNTSKTTFVETDVIDRSAKKVGYETISCNDGGTAIVCSLSLALTNGMLLGHLTIPISSGASTAVSGTITGGLGSYAHDKGTVKGQITGKVSSFTVTYRS